MYRLTIVVRVINVFKLVVTEKDVINEASISGSYFKSRVVVI